VASAPAVAPSTEAAEEGEAAAEGRKSSTCTVRWSHGVDATSETMKSSAVRDSSAHTKKKEMGLKQNLFVGGGGSSCTVRMRQMAVSHGNGQSRSRKGK